MVNSHKYIPSNENLVLHKYAAPDALNPDFVALLRGLLLPRPLPPTSAVQGLEQLTPWKEQGQSTHFSRPFFSGKAIATQAHPRSKNVIAVAQYPVKPMHASSTRLKRMTVGRGAITPTIAEEDGDDDEAQHGDVCASGVDATGAGTPCVMGEFRAVLDTLFDTLSETQAWYILHQPQ